MGYHLTQRISPPCTARWKAAATGAGTVLALALLAGCSAGQPASQSATTAIDAEHAGQFLAELGLEGLDAKQVIDQLDRLPKDQRPQNFTAQVKPTQLVLADESGRTANLPLPEDQYYLSAAPYVDQTHSCHFHSLTTCVGQLQGVEMKVKAVNSDTGEVLVDKDMESFDNGFIGLWVPRGITVDLEFTYQGKTAQTTVSTAGDEDATCLTELQLV